MKIRTPDQLQGMKLVDANPLELVAAFFSALADGRVDREEFIAKIGEPIKSGALEGVEAFALGQIYDGFDFLAKRAKRWNPFPRRSVEELLADAQEAEDEGNLKKARRLRATAENRQKGTD